MAGESTNRLLIIGGSGSGKSTLSEAIVEQYAQRHRYRHLVVLTKDAPEHSRLSGFCRAVAELDDATAAAGIDWQAAIRAAGSLYLEVTALDHHAALDAIGRAVLELGDSLIVVDEAQQIADRNTRPGFLQLWTRGRKHGINLIAISQSMKQRSTWGLHPTVINETTALITFLKTDPREVEQLRELFPELGDRVASLRTPRDGVPEWAVKDLITGRALLVTREGEQDITAGVSSPREGVIAWQQ